MIFYNPKCQFSPQCSAKHTFRPLLDVITLNVYLKDNYVFHCMVTFCPSLLYVLVLTKYSENLRITQYSSAAPQITASDMTIKTNQLLSEADSKSSEH